MTPEEKAKKITYKREWRRLNPDKVVAQRKRCAANALRKPDEERQAAKAASRAKGRRRYARVRVDPVLNAKGLANGRSWKAAQRAKIIECLGNQCAACGCTDLAVLQIDHINGDGGEHRKSAHSPYTEILKDISSGRYQSLCANCHSVKIYERKERTGSGKTCGPLEALPKPNRGEMTEEEYEKAYIAYHARKFHLSLREDPAKKEAYRLKSNASAAARRVKLLDLYGGKCVTCGVSDYRSLHIDHVYGDGHEHKLQKPHYYARYLDFVAGVDSGRFQLLCAGCNMRKRRANNETALGKPGVPKGQGKTYSPRRQRQKRLAAGEGA